jgi:mutator protein MutT
VSVGAAVVDGSRLLLIRRSKEPSKGLWSVPGGVIELGETVQDAVKREVKEETGIDVQVERLLDVADAIIRDEQGQVRFHYVVIRYLARPLTTMARPRSDVSEAKWVDLTDATNYPLTKGATKLVDTLLGQINRA